jgi:hypothetical protein
LGTDTLHHTETLSDDSTHDGLEENAEKIKSVFMSYIQHVRQDLFNIWQRFKYLRKVKN